MLAEFNAIYYLCLENNTCILQSQLSTGNFSIRCIPKVTAHSAPDIADADLNTPHISDISLYSDVSVSAVSCRACHTHISSMPTVSKS